MRTVLVTLLLALATRAPGAVEAQSAGRSAWPSRAKAVRGALKDAFRAYEKHASGFDDLAPVSRLDRPRPIAAPLLRVQRARDGVVQILRACHRDV